MKVLHYCTNDVLGGAARAAFRIHKALELKIESYMGVNNKHSGEYRVIAPDSVKDRFGIKILAQLNYQPAKFFSGEKNLMFSNGLFTTPYQIKTLRERAPDIVNLHWINEGLISIGRIKKN